jgi:hypothetical protein
MAPTRIGIFRRCRRVFFAARGWASVSRDPAAARVDAGADTRTDADADATPTPTSPTPTPAPTDPAAPQGTPAPAGASKVFNPDISVNGNFIAAAGRNPFATLAPFKLSEVEAAFQAVVDPYAKADFFLSVGKDGIEVEEGFITFTSLPGKFQAKVGKLRANFGKMNTQHTHALPSVDRPLVHRESRRWRRRDFGRGLLRVPHLRHSISVRRLTGEMFTGDSAVFQSDHRRNCRTWRAPALIAT